MPTPPDFLHGQHKKIIADLVVSRGFIQLDGAFFRQMKRDLGLTHSQVDRAVNALAMEGRIEFVRTPGRLSIVEGRS